MPKGRHEKPSNFKPISQGHAKSRKMSPGIMRDQTSAEVVFCNTSNAECLVFQSRASRFACQGHLFLPTYQSIFQNGVLQFIRNQKEAKPEPQRVLSCPKIVAVPPSDAKVEAPSMPNHTFGHQETKRFAKMSRIHNLKAMRNGQGPAAEGVDHKIMISLFSNFARRCLNLPERFPTYQSIL